MISGGAEPFSGGLERFSSGAEPSSSGPERFSGGPEGFASSAERFASGTQNIDRPHRQRSESCGIDILSVPAKQVRRLPYKTFGKLDWAVG
jgi:hypothetical protein